MRRVLYRVAASLDGYIAGPRGEVDWIVSDPASISAHSTRRSIPFSLGATPTNSRYNLVHHRGRRGGTSMCSHERWLPSSTPALQSSAGRWSNRRCPARCSRPGDLAIWWWQLIQQSARGEAGRYRGGSGHPRPARRWRPTPRNRNARDAPVAGALAVVPERCGQLAIRVRDPAV